MSCDVQHKRYRSCVCGGAHHEGMVGRHHEPRASSVSYPRTPVYRTAGSSHRSQALIQPSPETVTWVWNQVLPFLRSAVYEHRSLAIMVIVRCWAYLHAHHCSMPTPLTAEDIEHIWKQVMQGGNDRDIHRILSFVDAPTRQRMWQVLLDSHQCGFIDQRRFAAVCSSIDPTLIPDVMHVLPSLLRSPDDTVRTHARHMLTQWSMIADSAIQAQIATIARSLRERTHEETPTILRLTALAVLFRLDPDMLQRDRSIAHDLVTACAQNDRELIETILHAAHTLPYCMRLAAPITAAIEYLVRHTPYDDLCKQAAMFMMDAIRKSGSLPALAWWVQVLWDLLTEDGAQSPHDTLVDVIRSALEWEPAASVIIDRIQTIPSRLDTLPRSFLVVRLPMVVRGPWTPHVATAALTLAEALLHMNRADLVPALIGEGWGSGGDERIIRIIQNHSHLITDHSVHRVLLCRYAVRSPQFGHVCDMIRSLLPGQADGEFVRLFGMQCDHLPPDRKDDMLSAMMRISEQAPHMLHPSMIRWVWDVAPLVALQIITRMMRDLRGGAYEAGIRSLSFGWGRGHDAVLADTLLSVWDSVKRSASPSARTSLRRCVIEAVVSGIGHAPSGVITHVVAQMLRSASTHERMDIAKKMRHAWKQHDAKTVVQILRMIRHRSDPDVDSKIGETVRGGWGTGGDAEICALLGDIYRDTVMDGRTHLDHVPERNQALIHVITAIRDGWNHGAAEIIKRVVEEAIDHTLSSGEWISPSVMAWWVQAIVAGCDAIGWEEAERLLSRLPTGSVQARLAGLSVWAETMLPIG